IEEVRKEFFELGFKLLTDEYKNNGTQLEFEDSEGYKYTSTYATVSKVGSAKKYHKRNKYSIENIQLWLNKNKKPYVVTSTEYIKNTARLNFKCNIHGTEFDARWM